MTVTVCIPVFNRFEYVDEAVASVWRQTSEDVEIVIVDDGSTKPYRRKRQVGEWVVRTNHRGPAGAWNTGLMAAEGDWFMPLADDDWLAPDCIEQALAKTRAGTDVVVCAMEEHGGPGVRYEPAPVTLEEEREANRLPYTALFRVSALRFLGGWDARLAIYPDWGMWLTLLQAKAKFAYAPKATIAYRNHGGQHSKRITEEEHQVEIARVREFFP